MRVEPKHPSKVERPYQPRLAQTLHTPQPSSHLLTSPPSLLQKHKGRPLAGSPLAQTLLVGNLFNVVEIAEITLEGETGWGHH